MENLQMPRILILLVVIVMGLTACTTSPAPVVMGPDGQPLPRLYRIPAGSEGRIQFRVLDSVNSLRQAAGLSNVELDARLNAAAATHARDMSVQNRPWHFGSDGSSPIDRVRRAGYQGQLIGEAISETFETEVQTLAAWMDEEGTRRIIMASNATDMGFSYFQERNGKIWWTLVMGGEGAPRAVEARPTGTAREPGNPVNDIAATAIDLSEDT